MTMARIRPFFALILVAAFALATPAVAVEPDEILADAALEARARAISTELRCMVCQNQSIDDSDAELAKDLRVLVRERLLAGDTDAQVFDFVVARYGEFVLLKPRFSARNLMLWATPLVLLLAGAGVMVAASRRRRVSTAPLSAEETKRLEAMLEKD